MPETPKRRPGRPRKNPDAPMSPAERQAARRLRTDNELAALRHTVAEQAQEIETLRKAIDADENRKVIRNVVGEMELAAGLHLMRVQLLAGLALASTAQDTVRDIKGPMYQFAIGGKPMDRETRKTVFAGISAIDEAARNASKALIPDPDSPPPWTLGARHWQ